MNITPISYNDSAIPGRYTLTQRVRDHDKNFPTRQTEVLASREEIAALVRDGYLIRECLLPSREIATLRAAMDETVAGDTNLETMGGKAFGGIFIRHLMDKHPAFLGLLKFAPTLSIARAVFGPYVQNRGLTGRVVYPDSPNTATEWHFHQRLIPDPMPPWLMRPQTLDVLLYLDDITDVSGPLCVVPGSHNWLEVDMPAHNHGDLPGQKIIKVPAGSVVLCHGALWHRALPTQPNAPVRRLLLWSYGPGWGKQAIYGVKPKNGLTQQLLAERPDEETRELLGTAGFM